MSKQKFIIAMTFQKDNLHTHAHTHTYYASVSYTKNFIDI